MWRTKLGVWEGSRRGSFARAAGFSCAGALRWALLHYLIYVRYIISANPRQGDHLALDTGKPGCQGPEPVARGPLQLAGGDASSADPKAPLMTGSGSAAGMTAC